jgi:hypothetical protein
MSARATSFVELESCTFGLFHGEIAAGFVGTPCANVGDLFEVDKLAFGDNDLIDNSLFILKKTVDAYFL